MATGDAGRSPAPRQWPDGHAKLAGGYFAVRAIALACHPMLTHCAGGTWVWQAEAGRRRRLTKPGCDDNKVLSIDGLAMGACATAKHAEALI